MKNLVVFAMIMLVLASGYMYGTKLTTDMGINEIPALEDLGFNNLNSDYSENDILKNSESRLNLLDGFIGYLKWLWGSVFDIFKGLVYSKAPASIKDSGNFEGFDKDANIISEENARSIAQQYIEEPGAVAGDPRLVNYNGKLAYVVPVLLNGVNVGEIYIDAQTGKNLGGAGGVSFNNPDNTNQRDNNPDQINDGTNSHNEDNGIVNESPAYVPPQTNDS